MLFLGEGVVAADRSDLNSFQNCTHAMLKRTLSLRLFHDLGLVSGFNKLKIKIMYKKPKKTNLIHLHYQRYHL